MKKRYNLRPVEVYAEYKCMCCEYVSTDPKPSYEWEVHHIVSGTGEILCTCSSMCRRALGYPERKVST